MLLGINVTAFGPTNSIDVIVVGKRKGRGKETYQKRNIINISSNHVHCAVGISNNWAKIPPFPNIRIPLKNYVFIKILMKFFFRLQS